jgi:alkylhydroperoxidase/carboxymuconolactone decarboxylase family protein YurZ
MNNYSDDFRKKWQEMSGYVYPQYEFLAREDPEFAEAFYHMMKQWRKEGSIPLKYKEMMILMGSCVKMQEMAIRTHMTKALKLGATKQELLELMEIVLLSGGGVAMVIGLRVLMELTGEGGVPASPQWED